MKSSGGKKRHFCSRAGLSLTEMMVTILLALIVVLAAGILLVSGHRAWKESYYSVHKKMKQDALAVTLTFGRMGRKSNRIDYEIYTKSGDSFMPALPMAKNATEVVSGDAVEFRYWDVELDTSDSHNLLDIEKTGTAYALFYLDGSSLMVDYGPYPPGGIPDEGGIRNTAGIITNVLAENVSIEGDLGAFSHTVENGVGKGCVRINIVLNDPNDGEKMELVTATMMRNIWPR